MIYIYNDYAGTHTTSIAAAYHLGYIKYGQQLSNEEVLEIPYFNDLTKNDAGKLIFHGQDNRGDYVYTIGRKNSKYVVPSLKELCLVLFQLFEIHERVIFSNTSPTVPFVMSIGGGLSRGLGIDALGVPLLIRGAHKCHPLIGELVRNTKKVAQDPYGENVVILENNEFKI
ncbi:DUF3189 family protein [Halobacillus litoralis]|uniref:DUF3189 family protein n=1 Tax=Halobacillus litoralis TaxID=45668 RepID=UPI001CFD69B3|nr:DUF3189 family protein [Halobacillus litoralis]